MKNSTGLTNTQHNSDWMQEAGPLRILLKDPQVTEIMVNKWDLIFIEKGGVIQEASNMRFDSADGLMRAIQAIVVSMGKEVNRRNPYLDGRLHDGSRVNIVIPPVAVDGPILTIRKFSPQALSYNMLLKYGTIDEKILYFFKQAVRARLNVVVSGGTGSGKTSLLNTVCSLISANERIIVIEDTTELQLPNKNLVRMEAKLPMAQEPGVSIQDLVRNALRMRPDRIVIGECRGPETLDMLVAMNTGHEGSMTTLHANTAHDALRRLETMMLRTGMETPLSMIKEDIANTIHLVIQMERSSDGRRRVVEIVEVLGKDENNNYLIQDIFKFDGKSIVSVGVTPQFVVNNNNPKIQFPEDFFHPDYKVKLAG